jgi:hypothetical protein
MVKKELTKWVLATLIVQALSLFFAFSGISQISKKFDLVFQHKVNEQSVNQLAIISDNLKTRNVLRAQFTQKKHIKVLSRPLISKGSMIFAQEYGLYWQLDFPFHSKTIYLKNGMFHWKQRKRIPINKENKHSLIKGITSSFITTFSGNLAEMKKQYQIFFINHSNRWYLGLRPKYKPLSTVIKKIVLSGLTHSYFDILVIYDTGGDSTEIIFRMHPEQQNGLTSSERIYFQ